MCGKGYSKEGIPSYFAYVLVCRYMGSYICGQQKLRWPLHLWFDDAFMSHLQKKGCMSYTMRKGILEHMQTEKAQISLHSGPPMPSG